MFNFAFNFINFGNIELSRPAAVPNIFCRLFRNNANFRQRIAAVSLDLEPDTVFCGL